MHDLRHVTHRGSRRLAKATNAKQPILVVLHQEHSTPGRVGRLLREMGHGLDIRLPRFGDSLPKTLCGHAGAVVFGGPMSANDDDDFVKREIEWIGAPLRENKPFLGICLGAQMLARHLGARVSAHGDAHVERGYYAVEATPEGAELCGAPFPGHVYHWHREGFDLPRGATLLARGQTFPHQAFSCERSAIGLQFHPEVTYAMMCRWTTRAAEQLAEPGARPTRRHLEDWYRFDAAIERWISELLKFWLAREHSGAALAA